MNIKDDFLADVVSPSQESDSASLAPLDLLNLDEKETPQDPVASPDNDDLYYGMFSALY